MNYRLKSTVIDFFLEYSKKCEIVPDWLKRNILIHCNMLDLRKKIWMKEDPYAFEPLESPKESKYPYTLGILTEFCNKHMAYVAACRDLGVSFKVLDFTGPNWIEVIESSNCDAFLVWPSGLTSVWKRMYDERLYVLSNDLKKIVFPNYESLWLYESKNRMHFWLKSHGLPHPRTWVFYDKAKSLEFAESATFPIVFKTDFGSGASGVKILRDRSALYKQIQCSFEKGYAPYTRCKNDKEWGSVFLQEYLEDVKEWRMIRLGKSFFGHQKLKENEFHSGSGKVGWETPSEELLDLLLKVSEIGNFRSIDIDVFETADGRLLVNELQALFGSYLPYQMMVNNVPGRYLYEKRCKTWRFEEGIFCQNASCNPRVEDLIHLLIETL